MTSSFRKSLTAKERLDELRDEDIDLLEQPEPSDEMIARVIVRKGLKPTPGKQQVTLRLDEVVLVWFRSSDKGYQTRINQVLRAYRDSHKSER